MTFIKKLQNYLIKRITYQKQIRLNQRNIYILPTRQGMAFSMLLFLLLVSGINFNNSLIYFLTFLLVSITLSTMFYAHKSLHGLTVYTTDGKDSYCGDYTNPQLNIEIPKTKQWFPLSLSIEYQGTRHIINCYQQAQVSITLRIKATKRGYLKLPVIILSTIFPLGFFRAWSNLKLHNTTIIYPQPIPCQYQAKTQLQNHKQNKITPLIMDNEDFYGLDNYVYGQSLKKIHWKSTAKHQQWMSKLFEQKTGQQQFSFDINQLTSLPNIESKLSCLSYLLIQAEKNKQLYSLKSDKTFIPSGSGKQHLKKCMRLLALHSAT